MKDDVDEGTTDSAVSVDEWMDGLELGVGQRRLDDWRDVLAPDKRDEILEKLRDCVLGRGDELGVAGRFPASSAPREGGRRNASPEATS